MMFQIVAPLQASAIPPVLVLVERCPYCWSIARPGQKYPAAWSSTFCLEHATWLRSRRAGREKDR